MASKSKRRRRVLGASCILAALIIAGSSFAWFTSKDEVTNRLTATADYGVSIVEDFTPPKDMTPGQEVNKDVSVVNTGSVDAFVRLKLDSDVLYTRYDKVAANATVSKINEVFSNASGTLLESTPGITTVNTINNYDNSAANFAGTGTEIKEGYPNYQYSLYTFSLPNTSTLPDTDSEVTLDPRQYIDSNGVLQANEVTTLQAAGQIVVSASKSVAPNDLTTRSGDNVNDQAGTVEILYEKNNSYIYFDSTSSQYFEVTHNALNDTYTVTTTPYVMSAGETIQDWNVKGVQKDYSGVEQFKPAAEGFYIFRRSFDVYSELPDLDNNTATYAGYYFKGDKFYALETVTGDNGQTSGSKVETSVTLKSSTDGKKAVEVDSKGVVKELNLSFVTKDADNKNADCTMKTELVADATKDAAAVTTLAAANYIRVTIHDTDDDAADTAKDIIVYAKLADTKNKWTYIKDVGANNEKTEICYFYYNDELESGKTSEKLIDSVILDKDMTKANFVDLVYDINVSLDSVQVTRDQYNNESADGIVPAATAGGWATPTLSWDVTPGHNTYADINGVDWAATT